MKATVYQAFGSSDVLQLKESGKPAAKVDSPGIIAEEEGS